MTKSSLAQVKPKVDESRASLPGDCPCGRSHPTQERPHRWKRAALVSSSEFGVKHYAAILKAERTFSDAPVLEYSGRCEKPLTVRVRTDKMHVQPQMKVSCRKCGPCLRARTWYWALAGQHETAMTIANGLRTWFGTLTFTPEAQRDLLERARTEWLERFAVGSEVPAWWEDPKCDERFRIVRKQVQLEISRYWARLRKSHKFRYLVVIERHKTGLPHVHFLLHEVEAPIRKRDMQAQWPFGFSNVSIVGGKSRKAAAAEKAAWYVVKYLHKSVDARQMASQNYRPPKRANAAV